MQKLNGMIEGFIRVKEASESRGLSTRRIQVLCLGGRIEALQSLAVSGLYPPAEKPSDLRVTTGEYRNWRSSPKKGIAASLKLRKKTRLIEKYICKGERE